MAVQQENGHLYGPGITRISVSGFKSLATKTDVEIRPLTVLAGANSSGKSSLMQPLLLMKQTLESSVNPAGPFLLSGPYTRYTEAKQFLSRAGTVNDGLQPLTFEFGFDDCLTVGMAYSIGSEASLGVIETWGSDAAKQTKWKLAATSSPEELQATLHEFSSIPLLMQQVGFRVSSAASHGFFQGILFEAPAGSGMMLHELYFMRENLALNSQLRRLIYVSGLRGDQPRKWLLTDVPLAGTFEGPFESYVPSIIESWQAPIGIGQINELKEGLRLLGLTSDVEAKRLNESEIEVRVSRTLRPSDTDFVNIADVGLGISTVLPVLVALLQADPGQLVYIDEPDVHLHPKAQNFMAQLLVNAANRGVRLVIETHSSLLLQGILTRVARGEITPANVALHWFRRNEGGVTNVTTANLDAEGRVGEWPTDFDDVELNSTNDYLDAVEARLMAGKGLA